MRENRVHLIPNYYLQAIHIRLPQCVDFQTYPHSIKFSLKIQIVKPREVSTLGVQINI